MVPIHLSPRCRCIITLLYGTLRLEGKSIEAQVDFNTRETLNLYAVTNGKTRAFKHIVGTVTQDSQSSYRGL